MKSPLSDLNETDPLGILHAHVVHMMAGHCCDELQDEHLFPRHILRLVGTIQLVVDECFGGDYGTFHTKMLITIAAAACNGKDPLIEVERWLNHELSQTHQLYQDDESVIGSIPLH